MSHTRMNVTAKLPKEEDACTEVDVEELKPAPSCQRDTKYKRQRAVTDGFVNLVGIMERMDEQVLPAASSFIACAFKIGPADLGSITFWRAVVQALASPLGGLAGHFFDRCWVIFAGCSIWGLCTMLFAFSQTVQQGRLVWAFNGIGLSLIIPNSQSLIADYYSDHERGTAFGVWQLTGGMGGMLGALYATNVGTTMVGSMEGWRFSFLSVGLLSLLTGVGMLAFGTDPRRVKKGVRGILIKTPFENGRGRPDDGTFEDQALLGNTKLPSENSTASHTLSSGPDKRSHPHDPSPAHVDDNAGLLEHASLLEHMGEHMATEPFVSTERMKTRDMWPRVMQMLTTPTFLVIILQGIVGSMPWNGMVFFTLWFQLLGMGDFRASILMSIFLASSALGSLLGGWIGDKAAARYPNAGRIIVAQISVAAGIPLSMLIIWGVPHNGEPGTFAMCAILLFIFGLVISWSAPACNNPIFAEIVPEDMRNLIYAFDRSFEGALSAMSAFLVGWTAEHWFGFVGDATAHCDVDQTADSRTQHDTAKAKSLGNAMLLFSVVPWALCATIYTGLFYTYPRDRARVQQRQRTDGSPSGSTGKFH